MRFIPSRAGVIALIPLLVASGAAAFADNVELGQSKSVPHTGQFAKGTLSPGATVKAATGAAVKQANDTPHEWGQGAAGFGRRFASAFGKHIVGHTIHYTVARI